METKQCNKCKQEKSIDKFSINIVNSKKYIRKTCNLCRSNKVKKDGYYYVYYLPEEHYCGITNSLVNRMIDHRKKGKNTDNYRILYSSKDKKDACYHEALFQSTLAIEGLAITN
jgi:hypothetical protein